MPIDDYVKRRTNPFTKAVVEMLDLERLGTFRDDAVRLRLQSKKPKRGDDLAKGSRFGGQAVLPSKMKWPEGPEGPLTFVGQVDFEELAKTHRGALPLPGKGALAFFYDVENQPWGSKGEDAQSWKLVYVPDRTSANVVERDGDDPIPPRLLQPELEKRAKASESPNHQVWGAPEWVQGDPRLALQLTQHGLDAFDLEALRGAEKRGVDVIGIANDARQWRLLWQLDSEDGLFTWGDGGKLYILIREPDLRALRFDRAWCILQST